MRTQNTCTFPGCGRPVSDRTDPVTRPGWQEAPDGWIDIQGIGELRAINWRCNQHYMREREAELIQAAAYGSAAANEALASYYRDRQQSDRTLTWERLLNGLHCPLRSVAYVQWVIEWANMMLRGSAVLSADSWCSSSSREDCGCFATEILYRHGLIHHYEARDLLDTLEAEGLYELARGFCPAAAHELEAKHNGDSGRFIDAWSFDAYIGVRLFIFFRDCAPELLVYSYPEDKEINPRSAL